MNQLSNFEAILAFYSIISYIIMFGFTINVKHSDGLVISCIIFTLAPISFFVLLGHILADHYNK